MHNYTLCWKNALQTYVLVLLYFSLRPSEGKKIGPKNIARCLFDRGAGGGGGGWLKVIPHAMRGLNIFKQTKNISTQSWIHMFHFSKPLVYKFCNIRQFHQFVCLWAMHSRFLNVSLNINAVNDFFICLQRTCILFCSSSIKYSRVCYCFPLPTTIFKCIVEGFPTCAWAIGRQ